MANESQPTKLAAAQQKAADRNTRERALANALGNLERVAGTFPAPGVSAPATAELVEAARAFVVAADLVTADTSAQAKVDANADKQADKDADAVVKADAVQTADTAKTAADAAQAAADASKAAAAEAAKTAKTA